MAGKLKLEVVTPRATVYSEEVDMVTLPGTEGQMGIMPGHVPVMTQVLSGENGEVVARSEGQDKPLAIGEGFAEITGEKVVILTDMAERADDIDEAASEGALQKARARLVNRNNLTDEEVRTVEMSIAHSLAKLKVKRRQKRH